MVDAALAQLKGRLRVSPRKLCVSTLKDCYQVAEMEETEGVTTTWFAVHTRPWYGMRIETLRGVENPSRRVTRENVAQGRPKMGHVKTTV